MSTKNGGEFHDDAIWLSDFVPKVDIHWTVVAPFYLRLDIGRFNPGYEAGSDEDKVDSGSVVCLSG
jgi:hypothetical protein